MSNLFTAPNSVYPATKTNAVDYDIDDYITIDQELAYNPVKVSLLAYNNVTDADIIWMANGIKNPFKELTPGRIIAIPSIVRSSAVQYDNRGKNAEKKTVNVKVRGNKITY